MPVLNPLGWYAFLSLIPFILVYLRRPKPKDIQIPSLMFFFSQTGETRHSSFLQTLLRNLLFLVQLLLIILLALFILGPYMEFSEAASAEHTVLVIDVSASSQAKLGEGIRFDKQIDEARSKLEGSISIIAAGNTPAILLTRGNQDEALSSLQLLKPQDTPSNLGESILLAGDMIQNELGKVVVISDFQDTGGLNPNVAVRRLNSQDIEVELVKVGEPVPNVGIIGLEADPLRTTIQVKNFGSEEKFITLEILGEQISDVIKIDLQPESTESAVIDTPAGSTEIKIVEEDGLDVDNVAHIVTPSAKKISTLLITNSPQSNLENALKSSPRIQLAISSPPVVPTLNYKVIIIHNISINRVLPGMYDDIDEKVLEGSTLIVTGQEDIGTAAIKNLPIAITGLDSSSIIEKAVETKFTRGIDFGSQEQYVVGNLNADSLVLIKDEYDNVVSAMSDHGTGSIIFLGIIDHKSSFPKTPAYPIFWNNIVTFFGSPFELSQANTKTGRLFTDPESGKNILLNSVGVYDFSDIKVAANLLDEEESDVSSETVVESASAEEENSYVIEDKRKITVQKLLLALIALFLFFELFLVKKRGDF